MATREKEKKTVTFTMKMKPSLKLAAQERADELGRSLSNYIAMLIANDLKKRQK